MKTIHRIPATCALIILSLALFESGGLSATETPSEALGRAQRTYAAAGPFHETLELVLTMPDGSTARRRQDYGVGAEGGAFFRLAADGREGLRIVAAEGSALATWAHIPGRYAETD